MLIKWANHCIIQKIFLDRKKKNIYNVRMFELLELIRCVQRELQMFAV